MNHRLDGWPRALTVVAAGLLAATTVTACASGVDDAAQAEPADVSEERLDLFDRDVLFVNGATRQDLLAFPAFSRLTPAPAPLVPAACPGLRR